MLERGIRILLLPASSESYIQAVSRSFVSWVSNMWFLILESLSSSDIIMTSSSMFGSVANNLRFFLTLWFVLFKKKRDYTKILNNMEI